MRQIYGYFKLSVVVSCQPVPISGKRCVEARHFTLEEEGPVNSISEVAGNGDARPLGGDSNLRCLRVDVELNVAAKVLVG